MALVFVITVAGRAALVNAAHDGSNAVRITQAGVSATAIVPTPDLTTITDEIKRVQTVSGAVVADDTIHLVIEDSSADAYTVRSVGLYLADGTLFGVYGQADPLLSKTAQSLMLLAADLQFADVAAAQVSFGDTNFFNPPATTSVQGVVELATDQEAIAGADEERAITPGSLWAAVSTWLDTRFGSGAPSPFVKGLLVSASAVAMRISLGLKSAATFDAGPGNGLDADTVDGRQAAELALLSGAAFTGNITRAGNKVWDSGNDGAGSGLDADLLDGVDSSAFAKLSGAAFAGPVGVSTNGNTQALAVIDAGINGANLRLTGDGATPSKTLRAHSGNLEVVNSDYTAPIFKINDAGAASFFGPLNRSGSSIWDAGNDGSGSGLDADLFDGQDSAAFPKLATVNTYGAFATQRFLSSGNTATSNSNALTAYAVPGSNFGANMSFLIENAFGLNMGLDSDHYFRIGGWTAPADLLKINAANGDMSVLGGVSTSKGIYASQFYATANGNGQSIAVGDDAWIGDINYVNGLAIRGQTNPKTGFLVFGNSGYALGCNPDDWALRYGSNIVWHAGIDGSGSGLDADLLDGLDSTAFMKVNDSSTFGSNANGWWERRPNGVIEQWGYITINNNGTASIAQNVTFPIPFPHQCFGGNGNSTTPALSSGWNPVAVQCWGPTTQGMVINIDSTDPSHPFNHPITVFWRAIGN